jgi:hypothetical protein
MRILLLALLAAACGAEPDRAASTNERVDCATAGAEAFERVCTVERTSGGEGLLLTIRAPAGGFRRLLVTRDGRGVVAADGAEPATVKVIAPDRIEVAIGRDRYRLPATIR